jgi:hypothetical protein
MTPATTATLTELLQRADATHPTCDDASRELIRRTWAERPDAVCAAVQRTLGLEGELAAARQEIAQLKRDRLYASLAPAPAAAVREPELRALVGASSGHAAPSAGSAFRPSGGRTFEDVGARFFANHVGKAWVVVLLLTTIIVLVQEKLV